MSFDLQRTLVWLLAGILQFNFFSSGITPAPRCHKARRSEHMATPNVFDLHSSHTRLNILNKKQLYNQKENFYSKTKTEHSGN